MSKHQPTNSTWIVVPVVILFTVICIGGLGAVWFVRMQKVEQQMMIYQREAMMAEEQALQAKKQAQRAIMQAELARQEAEKQRQLQLQLQPTASAEPDKLLPPLETPPSN